MRRIQVSDKSTSRQLKQECLNTAELLWRQKLDVSRPQKVQGVEGRSFKNFKQREPSVLSVIRRSYVELGMVGRDGRSRFETDIADQHWEPSVRMKALVNGIQFELADHNEALVTSLIEPLECGILLTECSV